MGDRLSICNIYVKPTLNFMKTYIKLIYLASIICIIGGFFLIYVGIILAEKDITAWGITSLVLSFILFVIGETEHIKPPHNNNHYSL